jgi:putative ABC transport system substrate-binding protein
LDPRWAIVVLFASITLAPCYVGAQLNQKIWRIGMLEPSSMESTPRNVEAFRRGLRERGYIEGNNLVLEYRSADGRPERYRELAKNLVDLKVDLITTRGTAAVTAASKAGPAIPLVMTSIGEPIGNPFVRSLARPGGNVTGLSGFTSQSVTKRVQLAKELLPHMRRIAVLFNMSNPIFRDQWQEVQNAAHSLGLQAQLLDVRDAADLPRAFEDAQAQQANAMIVSNDAIMLGNRKLIVELCANNRIPAIYAAREFVEDGGLAAYAPNYPDLYYRAAGYVDKIFKGAKPGDLPIEQPMTIDFVINLKTASALGLAIPREVLLRADEAIR